MEHKLKIDKEYLENLIAGRKKCEIRCNDRDYQIGDILIFNHEIRYDLWEKLRFAITHIHSGRGMAENYVVLSVVLEVKKLSI